MAGPYGTERGLFVQSHGGRWLGRIGVVMPRAVKAQYQREHREMPARMEKQAEFARSHANRAQVPQAVREALG